MHGTGGRRLLAEAIALASVISGALVAILVPLITSRLESKRVLLQVTEARLDELRTILEQAAVAVQLAKKTAEAAMKPIQEDREPASSESIAQLDYAIGAVTAFSPKIAIRLSRFHDVHFNYALLVDDFELIRQEAAESQLPHADLAAARGRIDTLHDTITSVEDQFYEAASRLVGPRVASGLAAFTKNATVTASPASDAYGRRRTWGRSRRAPRRRSRG
jgi:hypothetical protein